VHEEAARWDEYWPAGQNVHEELELAPRAVEYVPLMHLEQFPCPIPELYNPGLQRWHEDDPYQEYWPWSHRFEQICNEEAPLLVEYDPAGHPVQPTVPDPLANDPGRHFKQLMLEVAPSFVE